MQPVASGLELTRLEVGHLSLDSVARCRPPVLLEPPGWSWASGCGAPAEPLHKRMHTLGHARGIGDRGLRIGNAHFDGPEPGIGSELPPPEARLGDGPRRPAPPQLVRELLPAPDRRRHTLTRKVLGDLGTNRCKSRVAALVEAGVRGKRGELGQMLAKRVVGVERTSR